MGPRACNIRRVRSRNRRGSASVVAMLFVVLFACLAIGFYFQVTESVQVADNERHVTVAQTAAESGMSFARYQVGQTNVSGSGSAAMDSLFTQLNTRLAGTANLGANSPTRGNDAAGNDSIFVPGRSGSGAYNWISLGTAEAGVCRFVVTRNGSDLYLKAVGARTASGSGNVVQRAIRLRLNQQVTPYVPGAAGLLVRGQVQMSNGAQVSGGDVFSGATSGTVPMVMSGGAKIDQKFFYAANTQAPSISNGAKVTGGVFGNATATFPIVDTSTFAGFVPDASAPAGPRVITASSVLTSNQVFTNIRIKANANKSFGNSQQINGVVYIESPNQITFGGGMRISGIIVTDNGATANPSTCTITIANGVRIDTLATLNPLDFSAADRIPELNALSGALALAPNYKLILAGGARSYEGAIVAGQIDISNGYRGTITGGMIQLNNLPFTMMGGGKVEFTGGNTAIPGLVGGGARYVLDPTSYQEVQP